LGSVHPFVPASRRFRSLDGKGKALSPHRVRHLLASFIIERVMGGDEDAEDLALQAIESLDTLEQASA